MGKIIKDDSNYLAFSSVITLLEVLSLPLRQSRTKLVEKYKHFLLNSANFVIFSIDPIIAEKAAEIRAQYGV
ncbi:PIN domain-containing protein [bacterium]|nr:PIN domain-containing protein [bacterium]